MPTGVPAPAAAKTCASGAGQVSAASSHLLLSTGLQLCRSTFDGSPQNVAAAFSRQQPNRLLMLVLL